MQTTAITFFILLFSSVSFAQDFTQTVKGEVRDADSKNAIPYATVFVIGLSEPMGAVSNAEGKFRIDHVPVGRRSFKISAVGYKDAFLMELEVSSGRELVLDVMLVESVAQVGPVVVKANRKDQPLNSMATVSAHQITMESTSRIAAGINDPARTAQSLAGVSAADDMNNELVIRGNSPRGMLWRMEGIEIPNPNHFSNGEGGSGGGVSALSTQVLSNSDFFTGAFPAEYGNALSGVFDLSLRKGNSDKREYTLQAGVLGVQGAMEGPFKPGSRASYLVNYRYSSLKLLSHLGIDITGGEIAPGWQDLSYKLYFPTEKWGSISLWGMGGYSNAGSIAERDTSKWEYRGDAYEEVEDHYVGITGMTHKYFFPNKKTYLVTVAALSATVNKWTEDSLDWNLVEANVYNENFTNKTFSASTYLNHKINARNTFKTGLIYHLRGFDFTINSLNNELGKLENRIDTDGETYMMEAYFQDKHRFSDELEMMSGFHMTYLGINGDIALEPRLGLRWKITKQQSFNLGAGLHSKSEATSVYVAENQLPDGSVIRPNEDLGLGRAAHVVLGHQWIFLPGFSLKSEVYYQHLYQVPAWVNDSTGIGSSLNFGGGYTSMDLDNSGSGRNYGLEMSLQKFFANQWYALATASVFESKYTLQGVERNTRYNSNYIFNVVGGKEFTVGKQQQGTLGTNIRVIWRGGYRNVPIDLEASIDESRTVRNYELAFENKAPDYFRIDLGVSYKRNRPTWSWEVSLNLQNATSRYNIWGEYYSVERESIETIEMTGLIPILNYKVSF